MVQLKRNKAYNKYVNLAVNNIILTLIFNLIGFLTAQFIIPTNILETLQLYCYLFFIGSTAVLYKLFSGKEKKLPMICIHIYSIIFGILLYPVVSILFDEIGIGVFIATYIGTILWISILLLLRSKDEDIFFNSSTLLKVGFIVNSIILIFIWILFKDGWTLFYSAFLITGSTANVFNNVVDITVDMKYRTVNNVNDLSWDVLKIYSLLS